MTAKKSVCFVSVPFLSRKDSGADEMNLKSVALGRVGTNRKDATRKILAMRTEFVPFEVHFFPKFPNTRLRHIKKSPIGIRYHHVDEAKCC